MKHLDYIARCNRSCLCCPKSDSAPPHSSSAEPGANDPVTCDGSLTVAIKKRPPPNGPGISLGDPWEDDGFKDDYPSIYSFLYDTKYDDGSSRVPGSISMFVSGYALKFAVNDKDRGLVSFVNAGTFFELMQLVEDGIRDDSLDWKATTKTPPGKTPPY